MIIKNLHATTLQNKYGIIYADPPWMYNDKSMNRGGSQRHYNCMALQDIEATPVCNIAAEDSVLFLWSTMPMLPDALEMIKQWGFTYKTCAFTWIKTNKDGSLFTGMGHYTRSNAELCLLAIRGKGLKRLDAGVRQVQLHPRLQHSRKPHLFRELIVKLYGNQLSRIELFARTRVAGWDTWGNEL